MRKYDVLIELVLKSLRTEGEIVKLYQIQNWERRKVLQAYREGLLTWDDVSLYDLHHHICYWPQLTGDDVKAFRKEEHLTQFELATIIGIDKSTVVRWEQSSDPLSSLANTAMNILKKERFNIIRCVKINPDYAPEYEDALADSDDDSEANTFHFVQPMLLSQNEQKKLLSDSIVNDVTSLDIRKLRAQLKLNRKEFAQLMRVSVSAVDKWERNLTNIPGPVKMLVMLMRTNDDFAQELIKKLKLANHVLDEKTGSQSKEKKGPKKKDEFSLKEAMKSIIPDENAIVF